MYYVALDSPSDSSYAVDVNRKCGTVAQGDLATCEKPGRGERIRTSGLYVPNVALYQAKLHPDGEQND